MSRIFHPLVSLDWLWNAYVMGLHVTLFLAAVALLGLAVERRGPTLRARVWALGLLGTGVVTVLCFRSGGWTAAVLPGVLAAPVGALRTADAASALAAWATALRAVWMVGAAVVLLRLLWGWLAIRETSAGARPVHDAGWARRLDEARAALGLRRAVDLRRSPLLAAPLTWGTLHPVVLLPPDADAWPEEHRRAVLLHELAHVRRLDCLVQVLGQLACAWWWFHPGVWWVAARLQAAREEACDARVLASGVRVSDYAECLLHLAERARRDPSIGAVAVSVGMARPTSLGTRVRSVLDPSRHSTEPSRLASALVLATGVVLVVAVGMMRLVPLQP